MRKEKGEGELSVLSSITRGVLTEESERAILPPPRRRFPTVLTWVNLG